MALSGEEDAMASRGFRVLAIAFLVSCFLASGGSFAQTSGQNFYITNSGDNTVSTFNPQSGTGNMTTIPVGNGPYGVAVSSTRAYVVNVSEGTVSVIDIATNTRIATINISYEAILGLKGIAVTPDGSKVYVVSSNSNALCDNESCVVVIDAATNTVTAASGCTKCTGVTVSPDGKRLYVSEADGGVAVFDTATNAQIGGLPTSEGANIGVAVSPDGKRLYVGTYSGIDNISEPPKVSVIDLTTGEEVAAIPVGAANDFPTGIAVSPGSGKVYVATAPSAIDGPSILWVIDTVTNKVIRKIFVGDFPEGVAIDNYGTIYVVSSSENHIDVIDPLTYTVTGFIRVGNGPIAFGNFIQSAPLFAGMPGQPNCVHVSIAALRRLAIAARALGFPTVASLRSAINAFCSASQIANR
jgi:YVTN family beta-propeller protein